MTAEDHASFAGGGASRAGERLRIEREEQGLSLAHVAERTRVPVRHLLAIEEGAFATLPAATYSAGFVKSYARLLGLDGDALARQFRGEVDAQGTPVQRYEPYEPADPARVPSRFLAWSMLAIAVLVGLGYLYWRGVTTGDNAAVLATQSAVHPAPATAQALPAAVAPAGPAAAPAAGSSALLTATLEVWMKVYEPAGKTLFIGVLKPGDHFQVPADAADPRLLTSRPNGLAVTVGQTAIPALGPPERRIKDVSLKPDALLARVGSAPSDAAPAAVAR